MRNHLPRKTAAAFATAAVVATGLLVAPAAHAAETANVGDTDAIINGPTTGTKDTCSATIDRNSITASASSVGYGYAPLAAQNTLDGGYAWNGYWDLRWGSQVPASNDEWIQYDLGSVKQTCGIKVVWDTDSSWATDYDIQVSNDASNWTTVASVRDLQGGTYHLSAWEARDARYVRVDVLNIKNPAKGVSIWEVELLTPQSTTFPTNSLFGDNTFIIDPSQGRNQIQSTFDAIFTQQEADQFSAEHYQFLLKPGSYHFSDANTEPLHARVGFNTSVSGVGLNPTDTLVESGDLVDGDWFNMNGTQNFWRSVENFTLAGWQISDPQSDQFGQRLARWGVSQAAPFRRMNIDGHLTVNTRQFGWVSGGYIADSKISGNFAAEAQQQWFTRDTTVGGAIGGNWNMTYSGVKVDNTAGIGTGSLAANPVPNDSGAPWSDAPLTVINETGKVAEKPFLYLSDPAGDDNDASSWSVFVPTLRDGGQGTTWEDGTDANDGHSVSLTEFFIAKPGVTAAQVNTALASGKHVLFTPGVYEMNDTIKVTKPGTIVLGLGLATIIPTSDEFGMFVADSAEGARVAGILFDAALTESAALFVVGDKNSTTDHSANPIVVSDIFLRIGGPLAGKVKTAMIINADDTIVDHVWSWRGDHGDGIGWDANTSDYGFVVNGDDVSAIGLFVEHFQKYNTFWAGERGSTIFYQNEIAYDVPSQEAWVVPGNNANGWAAYKVSADVTQHKAQALGSYLNFIHDDELGKAEFFQDQAFEAPCVEGVSFEHMVIVSLGGQGIYNHIINGLGHGRGGQADAGEASVPQYLEKYPTSLSNCGTVVPNPTADPATNPDTPDASTPGGGDDGDGGDDGGTGEPGECTAENAALGAAATANSYENEGAFPASAAVDGNTGTRWSSAFVDNAALTIDLGSTQSVCGVVLDWEGAYGKAYNIELSTDGQAWTTAASITDGDGGQDTVAVTGNARFVRIQGVERGTGYGYSLWEVAVHTGGNGGGDNGGGDDNGGTTDAGECTTANAALGAVASANSYENEGAFPASAAVDGNANTRWSSAFINDVALTIDLGSTQNVCGVVLDWEGAYGKAYNVQLSTDGQSWTTAAAITDGDGGQDVVAADGSARYVRIQGVERGTGYGYSLWEVAVHTR